MQTTETKRNVLVGVFIFIGLLILIVGIFTLGGQQKAFVKSMRINAVFSDIGGLKAGNNVWFSGVKIGTVKTIKFYGRSQVEVSMNIEQSARQYIRKDASAKLSSDGLIGNKLIVIFGGNPSTAEIEDGDILQVQKDLSTDDIMKTLQENNENLIGITTNFKKLSGDMVKGKGLAGTLLADSSLAKSFKAIVMNLQKTTQTSATLAGQLSRFSAKLNTKGGLADKMLTDTAVFGKLTATADQLKQTAAKATVITDNLSKASNKLNSTDNALGLLLNDAKTAEQVKTTMGNLQESSVKLNDDLEAAQHNFLLRGFFKKKEKAEAAAATQKTTN
ncbi:MlaD family protein [Mucilaginibacter sp.]|uniref:MlaD family protein n=1 Tax=Mucilaginibacter sp. TaxID=1882438 RepID=UPI003B005E21